MKRFDKSKITDIVFDGIDHADAPKYVDAYITDVLYDGRELTDDEFDQINNDYEFVHEALMDYLY